MPVTLRGQRMSLSFSEPEQVCAQIIEPNVNTVY